MSEEEYLQYFGKTRRELLEETRAELRRAAKARDKGKIKILLEKLKVAFLGDDIFWANEVATNMFLSVVSILLAVILVITVVLAKVGVYGFKTGGIMASFAACLIMLLIGIVLCTVFRGEKRFLKYLLMFIITLTVATTTSCLGYRATLAWVIPVVLSTKYLSGNFTKLTSALTAFFMVTSNISFAFFGVSYDLNNIPLYDGTSLTVNGGLQDTISNLTINNGLYLKNILLHVALPDILQFAVIAYICIKVADWGHVNLIDQARITKEFARVDTELNLANIIQAKSLPNIFPPFPEKTEFDIYAVMDPAKEVGGDFYDFFLKDDENMAIVMADVAGKGIPAALFMMIGKVIINNFARPGVKPSEVLSATNNKLCEKNDTDLFITAWIGILELATGKLTASSAGHEYPVIMRAGGDYELYHDKHGFVLGGMEGSRYTDYELTLGIHDRLFVYTDGVAEATSSAQELFGTDRLIESLNKCKELNQEELIKKVREDIDIFVGDAPQFDDITMLGLEYTGKQ